jgi:hypothetical protein
VGLSQLFLRWWSKLRGFAASIPGHLTALGILGTFVGIFCGLYKFDVTNLRESIPHLLEGMKLAFTTSIAGLGTSTLLRVTHSIVISITGSDPWGPISGDDEGGTVVVVPGFREYVLSSVLGFTTLLEKLDKIYEALKDIKKEKI